MTRQKEVAVSATLSDHRLDIRTVPEIALMLVRQGKERDKEVQYVTASSPSMRWQDQSIDGTKEVEHQLRIVRNGLDVFGEYLIAEQIIGRTLLHEEEFHPVVEVLRERLIPRGLLQLLYSYEGREHVTRLVDRQHNEILRKDGLGEGEIFGENCSVKLYATKRAMTASFQVDSEHHTLGVEWWDVPVDCKPHASIQLPEDPLHAPHILANQHLVD